MPKSKTAHKRKRKEKPEIVDGFALKPSSYQPSKAELEEDLSVPVSLEQLARVALVGGVPRKVR